MHYIEIPSDDQVVAALKTVKGPVTAVKLCNALVHVGHPRRESQLAIQRTVERGRIVVGPDWILTLAKEIVAA